MAKPKKRSKGLIPKRIAGVKVPKAVRKGRFGELLASRTGQAVIAQAILGAGAVAAGMKAADNPEVRARARAAKTTAANEAHDAADAAASAGSALAYALGEAAHAFAEALKRGGPKAAASGPPTTAPDADGPASPALARQ